MNTPTLRTLLDRHAFDLVVFLPLRQQTVTVNLWATDESHASSRAITELGGQGNVQVVTVERMRSAKCSAWEGGHV